MSLRPSESIHELLRNSLPGYAFLSIAAPLVLNYRTTIGDSLLAAVFVLGGPVVGLVFHNLYLATFRSAVWHCKWFRRRLGLNHIEVLQDSYPSQSLNELRAVWDYVFFNLTEPVTERVVFMNSRAHSWGGISLGIFVGAALWFLAGKGLIAAKLIFVGIFILLLLYRPGIRQSATLEHMLMRLKWNLVEDKAREMGWQEKNHT